MDDNEWWTTAFCTGFDKALKQVQPVALSGLTAEDYFLTSYSMVIIELTI